MAHEGAESICEGVERKRAVLETRAEVSSKGQMVDGLDATVMSPRQLSCCSGVPCVTFRCLRVAL